MNCVCRFRQGGKCGILIKCTDTAIRRKTMDYTYPDKDDKLTEQMITKGYGAEYWDVSEKNILKIAVEQVDALPEKTGKRKFLDLGCGQGRLISTFTGHVDEYLGLEPDEERFRFAAETGDRLDGCENTSVTVKRGDISILPENDMYDTVLLSHVLQHISSIDAADILEKISAHLEENGLLIVTTTSTDSENDLYSRDFWNGDEYTTEYITSEQFEKAVSESDGLPVRVFARNTIIEMAKKHGLDLVCHRYYHYEGHLTAADDDEANAKGSGAKAKDAFYIFRKREKLIDANICYHFSFSIFDKDKGLRTDDEDELRAAIKAGFSDVIFDNDKEAPSDVLFKDIATGKGFLHGGGLPFDSFRAKIRDFDLSLPDHQVTATTVYTTVFPDQDTAQACICISLKGCTVDDLVYFRHVQGNGRRFLNKDGKDYSIKNIFEQISGCLKRKITDVEESYLIEIKSFRDMDDVEEILSDYKRAIYGIMTGDEGWRHVPEALAASRLENSWGSREFIRLFSFGSNSVFFNLSMSPQAKAYRGNRKSFDADYYHGPMNEYFGIDSDVAGINHGINFAMEMVMVIKTICNRILRRQGDYYGGKFKGESISKEIRRIKEYRGELITTLSKIENLSIAEIGEMERVLLIGQNIDPIVDKIKYLLELLESELDLLYSTSNNRTSVVLAVAAVVIAAWQLIIAF